MTSRRPRRRAAKAAPQILEVAVQSVGAQGDGVAPHDGGQVFVPLTLPGERVRVEVTRKTGDGLHARPLEILEAAPGRVPPVCRHFGDCGGCSLQHMASDSLANWKRERVRTALSQRGLGEVPVAPTLSVPPGTRRRAVLAYRVTARGAVVGFNARGDARIVDQWECPLLDPALSRLAGPFRDLLASAGLPGASGDIWLTRLDSGVDALIDLPAAPDLKMLERLTAFGRVQDLSRLSWRHGGIAVPVAEYRPSRLRIGDFDLSPPPGIFLQPSREGEAALAERVVAAVGGAAPVADLFCGVGTFALRLTGNGRVYGADGDGRLIDTLRRTGQVETETRDLFRRPLAADELKPFAAVVFDPPRAGAKAQAETLAEAGPPVVAAVSCNPATFARDARILVDGGYALADVNPVDQFPWSAHVELTARFVRP